MRANVFAAYAQSTTPRAQESCSSSAASRALQPVSVNSAALATLPGRFLFGSDAPNNPLGARAQAQRIEALGLDTDVLGLIMGGTAASLVQADPPRER